MAAALGSHLETQMKAGTDALRFSVQPRNHGHSDSTGRLGDIYLKGGTMKRIAFSFVAVVTATGVIAWMAPSSLAQDNKGQVTKTQTGNKEAKQIIVTTIPRGY